MRLLGRTALILLAIVAVLAPALWIGRDVVPPRVTRWAINRAAGAEAIDDLTFRVAGLSSGHVSLTDLRVNGGDAFSAERVRLEFAPRELLDGRLRAAAVTGAELGASVGSDGSIGFDGLDPLIQAFVGRPRSPAGSEPAVRRLEFHDARLRLGGALTGRVRLDGTATPSADGMTASVDWRLDAETAARGSAAGAVAVAAEGNAELERDAAGTRARLSIADGRVARGALDVRGLRGTAALVRPADGPAEATVELAAESAVARDASLPGPSVHLRYDSTGISGTARLGAGDIPEITVVAVSDAATTDGRRPFRVEMRADLARVDALLAAWTERPPLQLRGEARAEVAGSALLNDLDPSALWAGAVASGGLTVALEDAALPDGLGRAEGNARLALALAAGRLSVETADPLVLAATPDAGTEAPGAKEGDAEEGGNPLLDGPATLTLGAAGAPFRALVEAPFGDGRAELDGPATLVGAAGGNAEFDGSAAFRRGAGGWRLDRVRRASVSVAGIRRAGIDLERLQAEIADLTLGPEGPDGRFEMSVRAGAPARGVTGAAFSAAGVFASDADGVRMLLSAPGRLAVDRVEPAGPLAPLEGFTARIAASERPVLTVPADGGPIAVRLPLELPALALASARPDVWRLDFEPMRITAEATLPPGGTGLLRVRLAGASATLAPTVATPDAVTLEGLAADLRMDLAADGPRLRRLDVLARRVADQARLARFTPLSLEGFARGAGTAKSPDRLAFRATLRGADGAFVLEAEGRHSPSAGRGEAEVTLFPIRFVPGGLQPADLSPAAAAMFRHATGELSLGGRVRWPGQAVPPDDPLTLTLKNLGFTGSLGTVTGLGGAVSITRVDPPATAPGQELSATAVDVGIPIVAPRVRFRLDPEQVLWLEDIEAGFAGGRVTAEDVEVPLGLDRPIPIVLTVEGVDAAELARATDLDGLAATGTLSGWLPLLWEPDTGLAVRQARLIAGEEGGTLRYRPAEGTPALQDQGEQVSLLLRAIRNFVYESFEVEADGRPGEPFDVRLRLRGANPDLFDGHPIALNVTLTGALDQLFGNLRRSLGLSDVIRRRLEASGGG